MGKTRNTGKLATQIQFDNSNNLVIGNSTSSSFNTSGSVNAIGGITGSIFGIGDPTSFSASISSDLVNLESKSASVDTTISSINSFTASNGNTSLNAATSSYSKLTGGNTFTGTQIVSASVYIQGDLVVQGSSSIQYISASSVSIGTNIVQLNTATPAVRFGGLSVQDSGSSAGVTGSMLWDSCCNRWIYSNPSGVGYSGGVLMSGPRASTFGNEPTLTCNYIAKSGGGDHLYDSCIIDDGTNVCINGNLIGTGTACFAGTICTANALAVHGGTGNNKLYVTAAGAGDGLAQMYNSTCTLKIQLYTNGNSYFAGGNLGIGNTAPTYQLDMCSGTTVNQRLRLQRGSDDTNQNMLLGWNNIVLTRSNVAIAGNQTDFSIIQCGSDGSRTPFYIGVGGISCFTCTVLIGSSACWFELGNDNSGGFIENHGSTSTKSIFRIQTSKINDTTNYSQFIVDPYCGIAFKGVGSGNFCVGIGTSNPNTLFHICQVGQPATPLGLYTTMTLQTDSQANYQRIRFDRDGCAFWGLGVEGAGSSNDFILSGLIGGKTTGTWSDTVFKIKNSNGYIGIGTGAPNSKLEVQKANAQVAGIFVNQCSADEATIRFKSTHSDISDYRAGASILVGSAFEVYNVSRNITNYLLNCNGFSKMSNNGSFVNGTQTTYHTMNNNITGAPVLYTYHTDAGGSGILSNVQACNTSTYTFRGYSDPYGEMALIYSNGTFGSRTGVYAGIISDVRCKTEITDATSQWNDVKNLRVRNFKLIEDVENDPENAMRQIGFIAQEVETVSPGLVFESGNGCIDSGCWKNVKTSIIHIKAVKALQEAMCRIEIQEETINLLKSCAGIV